LLNFTELAKKSAGYQLKLDSMIKEDQKILEGTKIIAKELPVLNSLVYTSVKWPVKIVHPLFEARTAFAVPNNYYQLLSLDEERMSSFFSHNSTRSIFFSGEQLMLYSKTMNHKEGIDYFTSFLFAHFEKGEYKVDFSNGVLTINANIEKNLKNLITGKNEKRRVSFNFVNENIEGRILTPEQAATSAHMRAIYQKYGGLDKKLASSDLEGYVVSVNHFSPHPYMLLQKEDFGFQTNREFQEHVMDYFKTYLNLSKKQ